MCCKNCRHYVDHECKSSGLALTSVDADCPKCFDNDKDNCCLDYEKQKGGNDEAKM